MCFCVKETFTYVPGNDLLQLLSMIFGNLFIRFLFSSMNKYSLSMAFAFCETWINSMLSCWLPELISVYLWWILLSTSPSRCMRVLMSVQWDESSHGMKISSFWEQKKHCDHSLSLSQGFPICIFFKHLPFESAIFAEAYSRMTIWQLFRVIVFHFFIFISNR